MPPWRSAVVVTAMVEPSGDTAAVWMVRCPRVEVCWVSSPVVRSRLYTSALWSGFDPSGSPAEVKAIVDPSTEKRGSEWLGSGGRVTSAAESMS